MDEHAQVPYIVYEGTMARMERTIKRLYILIIVSIAVTLITNLTWLYWWNQYEYVTETEVHNYEQDGEGINLIGDRNRLNYGPEVYEDESYEVSEEEER